MSSELPCSACHCLLTFPCLRLFFLFYLFFFLLVQASGIYHVPSFSCRQVPTQVSKHHFQLSSASSFMKALWSFLLQIESTEPDHIFQMRKYISTSVGSGWDGVNSSHSSTHGAVLCFGSWKGVGNTRMFGAAVHYYDIFLPEEPPQFPKPSFLGSSWAYLLVGCRE